MKSKKLARRVIRLAGSPFCDDRVPLLGGFPGQLGQGETIRACASAVVNFWTGQKGNYFLKLRWSWRGREGDHSTRDKFSPYKRGLSVYLSVCLSVCLPVCLLPMIFFNWYLNIDKGMTNLIVLLDLAKAFATISHNILLKKLELYGLKGVTLDWFSSYLSDRQQQCVVEGCVSRRVNLLTGTTFLYKNGGIDW